MHPLAHRLQRLVLNTELVLNTTPQVKTVFTEETRRFNSALRRFHKGKSTRFASIFKKANQAVEY